MAVRILVITEEADKRLPRHTETGLMGGRIQGAFNVDGKSGAAQYTMPITVPKGHMAMEPKLQLAYSSNGDNGHFGVGWELVGLPLFIGAEQTPSLKAPKQIVKSTIVQSPGRFGFLVAGYKVIVKEETGGELVQAIITIGKQVTIKLKTTQLLEDAREIKPFLVVLEVLSE